VINCHTIVFSLFGCGLSGEASDAASDSNEGSNGELSAALKRRLAKVNAGL
jgi:hypothetical protein